MQNFYLKSFFFWFILLLVAFFNAIIRETTYKPFLEPHIGTWAHQISSLTGIILFFIVIFLFLKKLKGNYSKKDLLIIGIMWIILTLIFETIMNYFWRELSFEQIISTYYFWKGETWIFVLISLLVSPFLANRLINHSS